MTFLKYNRGQHIHRYFVDAHSGDEYCLCGKKKGEKESESKYKNRSTIYDDKVYDSAFEAEYAAELDMRKKGKDIKDWKRQIKLDLRVNGIHITNYYIDFLIYHNDGTREFLECKGKETMTWIIKWRLFEALFNDFKEHPDDKMTLVKLVNYKKPRFLR